MLLIKGLKTMFIIVFTMILIVATIINIVATRIFIFFGAKTCNLMNVKVEITHEFGLSPLL